MIDPAAVEEIKLILGRSKRVLVTTHIAPDGDALGSLTAVGLALERLGKKPTLVCDDGLGEPFTYLPFADKVVKRVRGSTHFDAVFAVDCGDLERTGRSLKPLKKKMPPIINIDHHVSNTHFGTVNIVISEAPATAEILTNLLPQIGVELDCSLATCLLTGLVTDTQAFRIPSVTAETLRAASLLTDAGANLAEITMRTLVIKDLSTVQQWRIGLNNMHLEDGLAWTTISQADLQLVRNPGAPHDGLNNILADIEEAKAGIVFTEREDGRVKVGFRSRPPVDVAQFATKLGGGGHRQAAGALINGPLDDAVKRVIELVKQELKEA